MPLTIFHIAAGLPLKAISPRFDFWTFGAVQVVLDLEPASRILTHTYPLHGPLHSWPGALGVGLLVAGGGRALGRKGVPALVSGIVGGASHVLLDAYSAGHYWPATVLAVGLAILGVVLLASREGRFSGGGQAW